MRKRIATLIVLAGLGAYSIPAQIFLIREFLSLFNGNELALGTVMGFWRLLTGAGAWLAHAFPVKKGRDSFIFFLLILLAVIPILTIFKLDMWRVTALPYGTMTGLREILFSSFMALLPFCLVNGYLFISLTSMLRDDGEAKAPGMAYAVESSGGLLGGALANFIVLWLLNPLGALRIFFVIYIIIVILFAFLRFRWLTGVISAACFLLLALFFFLFPFEELTRRATYRDQEVALDKDTPYGKVTITRLGEQLNYYGDGMLLFSTGDVIRAEESVHFAMLQHPAPKRVLLVSGGLSGAISEILKYRPDTVDYLEINPVLASRARQSIGNARLPGVFVFQQDARLFLHHSRHQYDVMLINAAEPSTLQLNRFYSVEFFRILKKHLSSAGVVMFSLPSTADYISPEAGRMNAILRLSLKSVFGHVAIVPGSRTWFLASARPWSLNLGSLADARVPANEYVNSFYIDDNLLRDRAAFILNNLPPVNEVNHDFHPVIYLHQLSYWLSHFRIPWPAIFTVIMLVLIFLLFVLNRISAGVFAGGFTGASLELIIMLSFQVAFGYVFSTAGVVITLFMLGLSAGPWLAGRLFPEPSRRSYLLLLAFMSVMPLLMLGLISAISAGMLSSGALFALLFPATLAVSLLVGMQYAVATAVSSGEIMRAASRNYAADLAGSALGAFLVPIVLLPLTGIKYALLFLALLNIMAVILNSIPVRHRP